MQDYAYWNFIYADSDEPQTALYFAEPLGDFLQGTNLPS